MNINSYQIIINLQMAQISLSNKTNNEPVQKSDPEGLEKYLGTYI